MADERNSLRHNPSLGEVNPRTYGLVCNVKFNTVTIGTTQRQLEINRMTRIIDRMANQWPALEGQRVEVRLHYTRHPDKDPRDLVEVRVQPLTVPIKQVDKLIDYLRSESAAINEAGKDPKWGGWTVLSE